MIPLFGELTLETVANCNRACPTCLRQSYPNRELLGDRFGKLVRMSFETYCSIIDQAVAMGFRGRVNLQFADEPLMDRRLEQFARYARDKGVFRVIQCYTNADLLTEKRAAELDGLIDIFYIALYGEDGQPLPEQRQREDLLRSWFTRTRLAFTGGGHVVTHYSPMPGLQEAIERARPTPCVFDVQERLIIDHRGEMLLCCDDIGGEFDLGNVANHSLYELWFGQRHQDIVTTLARPGGRRNYAYCSECPR